MALGTSLPELVTSVTAARKGSADIAIGNIVGSNIFNFIIMAVVDILYRGSVYDFSDPQTVVLMLCGTAALPIMWIMMKFRNKATQIICPLGIIACYVAFLMG